MAVPYLTSRDRKGESAYFIWQPGKSYRQRGWRGVKLTDQAGRASTHAVAMAQGQWLYAMLTCATHKEPEHWSLAREIQTAWRGGDDGRRFHNVLSDIYPAKRRALARLSPCPHVTYELAGQTRAAKDGRRAFSDLRARYEGSTWFKNLSAASQRNYRYHLAHLVREFGQSKALNGIRRNDIRSWYEENHGELGVHVVNARARVLSAALSYAVELDWLDVHPMARFRMEKAPSRIRIVQPAEYEALLCAADEIGRPSIGLACALARHTGQRRGDLVALTSQNLDGSMLKLKQNKRGRTVKLEIIDQRTLDRLPGRSRTLVSASPALAAGPEALICSEQTGLAYQPGTLSVWFGKVRDHAAKSLPSCSTLLFKDFRDTHCVDLVCRNLSLLQICSRTGHTPASVQMICNHYVELTDDSVVRAASSLLKESMQ